MNEVNTGESARNEVADNVGHTNITDTRVTLYVNGNDRSHAHEFSKSPSIEELFTHLQIEIRQGLAVAVNQAVISKSLWATHQLQNQDKILIISATQGG